MKILVTGANGYIGSKVVKQLCDLEQDVIATDFSNEHIDTRAKFISADIFEDKENWFEYFGKPDVCIHLAWRDGFVHNSPKHMGDLLNHFNFLTNLIDNGLKRLAVMGTMHEVGYHEGIVDENTPCNPQSQYGIAKNYLRQSLELYVEDKECKLQWLRGFYIYGNSDIGNSIFCKILRAAKSGQKTFPLNSGKNEYDFINEDVLAYEVAVTAMQDQINGIINICSGQPVSLKDQVEWFVKEYNIDIQFEYGAFPDRPYDSPCIYGDNSKIKKIMESREQQ